MSEPESGHDGEPSDQDARGPSTFLLEDARPYVRSSKSLDFDRVAFFSDAVFAIALTLLVVGIAVPTVREVSDAGEMWDALVGLRPEFVSFFIGFAVIGRYWLAHVRFVSVLRSVDTRLMAVNLAYLAFIAFLPFPTALVGRYEQNVVAFAFYALVLAIVSALESVLFVVAERRGLLRFTVPHGVKLRGLVASSLPVAVFLASIPLALVTNSTVALVSWIAIWPLEALVDRHWPETRQIPAT